MRVIELLIQFGANNWNGCLAIAVSNRRDESYLKVEQFFEDKGADNLSAVRPSNPMYFADREVIAIIDRKLAHAATSVSPVLFKNHVQYK